MLQNFHVELIPEQLEKDTDIQKRICYYCLSVKQCSTVTFVKKQKYLSVSSSTLLLRYLRNIDEVKSEREAVIYFTIS
jgi:hypothetical protein